MSYILTLDCGCDVYVACHPDSGLAHTRVIEHLGAACQVRSHAVGTRLQLWELLPQASQQAVGIRLVPRRRQVAKALP